MCSQKYIRAEIHATPIYKSEPHQAFVADVLNALALCTNLTKFICAQKLIASFLLVLTRKENLKDLRINANLTAEQAKILIHAKGLQKLALDYPTPWVMSVLPNWVEMLERQLSSLTITVSYTVVFRLRRKTMIMIAEMR